MINTANGMMSTAPSGNAQSPGLKTYFKTPEGRYKLHYEKTHPSGLLHYTHGKTVTQVILNFSWENDFLSLPIFLNLTILVRFLLRFFLIPHFVKSIFFLLIPRSVRVFHFYHITCYHLFVTRFYARFFWLILKRVQ